MPTYTFTSLNELLAYLQTEIAPNGNQEITGQRHQDVVLTMAQSLVAIASNVPPSTINQFPPYEAGTTYTGGVEVVVRHGSKLWIFISPDNQEGVEPGSNGLVWRGISAAELSHLPDHDQYLDRDGPNEVSAVQLRALVGSQAKWLAPVQNWNIASDTAADASSYTRVVVSGVGASGAFTGHENAIASKVGGLWSFEDVPVGGVVMNLATDNLLTRTASGWWQHNYSLPSLAQVMSVNGTTAGTLYVAGALVRKPVTVNHAVAGTYAPSLYNSSAFDMNLSADIHFDPSGIYNGGEWRLIFRGISGGAITYGSNVEFSSGLVPPTSVAAGYSYIMRGYGRGGKVYIENIALIPG